MPRVVILSHCSNDLPMCRVSRCNHAQYAKAHGYMHIHQQDLTAIGWTTRVVLWLRGTEDKMWWINHALHSDRYDFVCWMDADALFVRWQEPLTRWMSLLDEQRADVLATSGVPGWPFRAGSILVRRSEWSKEFFQRTLAGNTEHPLWSKSQDRSILFDVLLKNALSPRQQIHLPEGRPRFQAMAKLRTTINASFVVHLSCCQRCDLFEYDAFCAAETKCVPGRAMVTSCVTTSTVWTACLLWAVFIFAIVMGSISLSKNQATQEEEDQDEIKA